MNSSVSTLYSIEDHTRRLNVVALGNRYRRDDGIALRLLDALELSAAITSFAWEDADALTIAHNLLELSGPVVIVDCAEMDLSPGAWRFFSEHDARLRSSALSSVSTHGLGLAEALDLAHSLGFAGPTYVFAVQPFDFSSGPQLSPVLQRNLPLLKRALLQSLAEVNRSVYGD